MELFPIEKSNEVTIHFSNNTNFRIDNCTSLWNTK